MKVTINIECTPAEARQCMGLPDVAPLQEAMLADMQEKLRAHLSALQPAEMVKTWFPLGVESLLAAQKAFWAQVAPRASETDDRS